MSNKTKNDIILKTELDNYITLNKNLSVNWTLTRHNETLHGKRAGLKGRITQKMLDDARFPMKPVKDTLVLICGPKKFEMAMVEMMMKAGWKAGKNLIKL